MSHTFELTTSFQYVVLCDGNFSISYANNMQINKQKTKEMIITTSRTASVPLYPDIHRVETFKLLGTVVSKDLKWNPHIAYIIHKENSRLHFLRQLKRAAVPHHDMLTFLHRSNSVSYTHLTLPTNREV